MYNINIEKLFGRGITMNDFVTKLEKDLKILTEAVDHIAENLR